MESKTGFAPLKGEDEYTRYFNQLCFSFEKLLAFFQIKAVRKGRESYEARVVSAFLRKMLYTVEVFRKKYTCNPDHNLKVALSESGFPSFFDIDSLSTDLVNRESRLAKLPTLQALKQEMLDYMFKYKSEPRDLLQKACERSYYEMLLRDKLFLTLTPESLRPRGEREKFRSYTVSWGCYDFGTNRPYIYIMLIDQDLESAPLEKKESNYRELFEVIRAEGSRAPGIGVVAMAIDSNLKDIHPKIVKRICVGPIYTRHFSKGPEKLSELLNTRGENEDDFILMFRSEIVFSTDQQMSRSLFSFGQLKEIFFIPETDVECYVRKASKIRKYMLIPHTVLQHMDFKRTFREYAGCEIISYDKGGIHAR